MFDIKTYLPGKRKSTASGWISFNAVCCVHNGHSQDKRGRGGIKTSNQGWSYHPYVRLQVGINSGNVESIIYR